MSFEAILVLAILVGAVVLFVSETYPIDFVALLVLGTLLALGLITPRADRARSAAAADGHHLRRLDRLLDLYRLPDEHDDLQPGGYRYTDSLRTGVPLSILFWILSVIFIPRFWSF